MSNALQQFVSDLPEIYQMVYAHPEWNEAASRDCLPRLQIIAAVYDRLSLALDRPLRVLDLGCAQGFYSLSLAEKGASVKGIDFLPQNVALCGALADEHPDFDVTFVEGRIEEVIDQLENDQFDLVIGLSVFHHLVHGHGTSKVQQWLTRLLDHVEIALLELALKEEPLYWGPSQPDSPLTLFEHNAFYQQLAEYPTHLSAIKRPLYLLSNRRVLLGDFCRPFTRWSKRPHSQSDDAHHDSRRYYFGGDFFCKVYHAQVQNRALSDEERERNRQELHQEIDFLSRAPAEFPVARLLASGENEWQGWNILSKLPGELLDGKLLALTAAERENVLHQILQQLASLERAGLYHDDVRTWNILVDERLQIHIIDYGSISNKKADCAWPENLLQAFFVTLNEIVSPSTFHLAHNRPLLLSPLNLPAPYAQWLYAFCQHKPQEWSFALLLTLFERKATLPVPLDTCSATEVWIAACEKWLLQRERYDNHLHHGHQQTQDSLASAMREEMESRFSRLYEDLAASVEQLQELAATVQSRHYRSRESEQGANASQDEPKTDALVDSALAELSREALTSHYQAAARQAMELRRENRQLKDHNRALLESRSWRLTSPYRYMGLQVQLLRQHGVKGRAKQVIKRCARGALSFLQRHPALKSRAVALLHRSGQYERAKRIYRRVAPAPQRDLTLNHQALQAWSLQDPQRRLPPAVNTIFDKLRIK
ncbi:methyltransferase domain-containing protein [Candidatus Sodalis sp. SoCistrobi]|uniref:methyltransferase domain-containing protein n=1 Tax=Candidatus Sodalis sp. SoCistrobi TaxID=1922216 RepID=UPI00093B7BE4|nr:methyltransferase domain-containing protein [Candidatus Sodalis sp. SoCistrobi]